MSNALSSGAAPQNTIQDALSSPRIDVNNLRETYATARERDERGDEEESSESLLTESEDEEGNEEAQNEAALDNNVVGAEQNEPANHIFEAEEDDLFMDDSCQEKMMELFRNRRNMANLLHLITVSKGQLVFLDNRVAKTKLSLDLARELFLFYFFWNKKFLLLPL